jgi:hypothetical protein
MAILCRATSPTPVFTGAAASRRMARLLSDTSLATTRGTTRTCPPSRSCWLNRSALLRSDMSHNKHQPSRRFGLMRLLPLLHIDDNIVPKSVKIVGLVTRIWPCSPFQFDEHLCSCRRPGLRSSESVKCGHRRCQGSSRDWGPAAHAWVRPIDDSGTCLLFVTELSNQVKTLFTLLTSDEGKVDH